MRNEKGFTLIEIVMVIVLLGILAAVALPRFINLQDEASNAAVAGVAGAAASGMAINLAGCLTLNHVPTAGKCVAVDNCNDAPTVVQDWPAGYTATANGPFGNTSTATCYVVFGAYSTTFTGIGAGN